VKMAAQARTRHVIVPPAPDGGSGVWRLGGAGVGE
jgi:hypothetical protein